MGDSLVSLTSNLELWVTNRQNALWRQRSWPKIGSFERSLNDANNDAPFSLILIHGSLFD